MNPNSSLLCFWASKDVKSEARVILGEECYAFQVVEAAIGNLLLKSIVVYKGFSRDEDALYEW